MDWASKQVEKALTGYDWNGKRRLSQAAVNLIAAKLLRTERARTRRMVREMKKEYYKVGAVRGYGEALDDLLARLGKQ